MTMSPRSPQTQWLSGDTITAISSPPGRGAIALVRVSGPDVRALATALLSPAPDSARHATLCSFHDRAGEVIDEVVATLYLSPNTFTGEDLLEISTHGGLVVPSAVLAAIIEAGAREAAPGEFTRRAVLNGKIDLLQAEAIGDLIDARSTAARHVAMRQLDGGLSRRITVLRESLLDLEALLAYDIDFPEEDDGPLPRGKIVERGELVLASMESLLATGNAGALVHDGALVVLAGAPNTGKSSLFNALLGEARAIVTEVPGTTRDAIEAVLDLPGWPVRLVDTAGIRETNDPVERLGIETSSRYLARAAVVVACVDSDDVQAVMSLRQFTGAPIITTRTKGDLVPERVKTTADVIVSANTGEGLSALLGEIVSRLSTTHGTPTLDAPILTRARQRKAVQTATEETRRFITAWRDEQLPASIAATHVNAAADALGELIGAIHVDDVLEVVFRTFCVGK
jgi:tRNA modification GTPase